jgi:hypothetical protein
MSGDRPPRTTDNRPALTITCVGTTKKRHSALDVKTYRRDDDGTWMPVFSGTRTNTRGEQVDYISPDSGMLAKTAKFNLECPNPRCSYKFRNDSLRVAAVLNEAIAAGRHEMPLLALDIALERGLADK